MSTKLLHRLGGAESMKAVTESWIDKLVKDDRIKHSFGNYGQAELTKQKVRLATYCAAMFSGSDMEKQVKPHNAAFIKNMPERNSEEFRKTILVFRELFVEAMKGNGMQDELIAQCLDVLSMAWGNATGDPSCKCVIL